MMALSPNEQYLAYLCGEGVELPLPSSRNQHYLAYLCGMDVELPEPHSRNERYLAKLCGLDVVIPEAPSSLNEHYLAALCGEEVELPEPTTRIAGLLSTLLSQGVGGYHLVSSDFMYQTGNQNTYNSYAPYYKQIASRASYVEFDIRLKPGATYSFQLTTTDGKGFFGTQYYNQNVLDAVAACQDYSNGDILDPGWHAEGQDYSYTAGQVNGLDIVGVRLTVKNGSNSTVEDGYVTSLVITREG